MPRVATVFTVLALALGAGLPARASEPSLNARSVLSAADRGPAAYRFPGIERVTLNLRTVDVLAPGARFTQTDAAGSFHGVAREPFTTLEGRVVGDPGSLVALTVAHGWVAGFVTTRGRSFSIEPDDWSRPTRTIITQVRESNASAARVESEARGLLPPAGIGILNCSVQPCNRLATTIVLDSDKSFRSLGASTCQSRQIVVFNGVRAIYALTATKIDLTVSQVNCRTADEFSPTPGSILAYLEAVKNSWTGVSVDRSVVQVSVGFGFDKSQPVGLSYLGGVCARIVAPVVTSSIAQQCSDGYSVYQAVGRKATNYNATTFLKTKIAAHELGHSFNADHDNIPSCRVNAPRRGPIMCSFLQELGPNTFSPGSAASIRRHAEQNIGSITGT